MQIKWHSFISNSLMKCILFILLINDSVNSFWFLRKLKPAGNKPVPYDVENVPAYNKHFLNQLINNIEPTAFNFAVFDHDGTLALGDISAAMMYQQIEQHKYKIPVKDFISLLSLGYDEGPFDQCLPKGMETEIGKDIDGNPVTFQQLLESLFEDYVMLKRNQVQGSHDETAVTVVNNFKAKLGFYNDGLFGIYKKVKEDLFCRKRIGLGEIPQLWYGLSKDDIGKLARDAIEKGAEEEYSRRFTSTGKLKVIGTHYPALKPVPQQIKLVKALQNKKVEVRIVTAAPKLVVQAISMKYGIEPTLVYGAKLMFDNDGGCTGVDLTTIPYNDGKALVIDNWELGKPILASGDTSGDLALLNSVSHNGIKLIVNTLPSNPLMLKLYKEACDARIDYSKGIESRSHPRVLIQGVDHIKQEWIPTAYSTYSQPLEYTHSQDCKEYSLDSEYSLSAPQAVGGAYSCHGAGHDHDHCNHNHGASAVQSNTKHKHPDPRDEPEHTHAHDHCEEEAQHHGCSHGHGHSHNHNSALNKGALVVLGTTVAAATAGGLYTMFSPKEQPAPPPDTNSGNGDPIPSPSDGQSDSSTADGSTAGQSDSPPTDGPSDSSTADGSTAGQSDSLPTDGSTSSNNDASAVATAPDGSLPVPANVPIGSGPAAPTASS